MTGEFSRRSFLKYTALTAVVVAGSSLLTGCGAADVGLDKCQVIFFTVIRPDAAMDTGGGKALGRADAARNFFILHLKIPLISNLSVSLRSTERLL